MTSTGLTDSWLYHPECKKIDVSHLDEYEVLRELYEELRKMPDYYKGDTTVYLFTENDRKNYRMPKDVWVNLESDVIFYLKEIVGDENVKIIE